MTKRKTEIVPKIDSDVEITIAMLLADKTKEEEDNYHRKQSSKVAAKKVAGNIKFARLYRNYSQSYVANELKMTQMGFSKLELCKSKLSLMNLYKIADILNFEPMELINGIDLKSLF